MIFISALLQVSHNKKPWQFMTGPELQMTVIIIEQNNDKSDYWLHDIAKIKNA